MDRKEKQAKKAVISEYIDLANGRFKDEEVEKLHDLVTRREEHDGKSRTYHSSHDDWCSDGRYTRHTDETYTFVNDEKGVRVEYDSHHWDDDGGSGSYHETYDTGRSILNALGKLFG